VDDATVAIENIHRHMGWGRPLTEAILEGAAEIAMPAFVSTLCICIVFVPMFFLTGTARYLFVPLAEAVVFAMLASYVLSRTLVPTLVMWFYRNVDFHRLADPDHVAAVFRPVARLQKAFGRGFERIRARYRELLGLVLHRRLPFALIFLVFCGGTCLLIPQLGQDFFPSVDAGRFRLHIRARSGLRIEETARLVDRIEAAIRQEIPAAELAGMLDNIGMPNSSLNLSYSDSGVIGAGDADILVALREDHRPTSGHMGRLRRRLNREFPGVMFYFLPADIVSQTINFGLPAPFDVQLVGRDQPGNREVAARLAARIRQIPGTVDVRVHQPADRPKLAFAVDRSKASAMNLSERDVASSVLLSLSGSGQVNPVYWVNPAVGIQYLVSVRVPERKMDSLDALNSIPVNASQPGEGDAQLLANLATVSRAGGPPVISHYNIMPVIDVFGGVSGRDLGGVLKDLKPLIRQAETELPRGSFIMLRGQADTMRSSFVGLGIGFLMAVLLIYLLLVVNFQSWLDPFIIITALPGAVAGVVWGLHLTLTTLSVPALM
jgi:multidrug efflux pump subunit AcrB